MIKRVLIVSLCLVSLLFAGCRRGDIKVELVIKGQTAPFRGYIISSENLVEAGDDCTNSGVLIWLEAIEEVLETGDAGI